ncbi:MAG: SDR family NAD(P)-dependent oxidoreductase [Acetobacteraceae bacterium]|nr:SDR family NAD(P)-dependent oxidoreductase [Acetobacteraceae bacterium]
MPYVALITGASSGIGEAAVRRVAQMPDTRVVLVARREDRLRALAEEIGGATVIAQDLLEPSGASRIRRMVERDLGELHLLVNNAGQAWRGRFDEKGWANVDRHMKLNFEAPVRLTQELLPLLRRTASSGRGRRVAIVNVASTAGRVSRPGSGAYSASKFALAGWSDALYAEERAHGVHVGLVLPGFVRTEGFPARELLSSVFTRWLVSRPEVVAEAILEAGPGVKPERYVPRGYWMAAAARILAPNLVRRATSGGKFTPAAGSGGGSDGASGPARESTAARAH